MDDELTELVDARLRLEKPRERRPVVVALELEQPVADLVWIDVRLGRQCRVEGIQEGALEQSAELKQRDLALPDRIDVGKAAIAELEADVESEVEVVVDEWIDAVDRLLSRLDLNLGERRTGASRALRLGTEQLADMPAQMTNGVGERRGRLLGPVDDVTRCAHRQNLGSRRLKS